jgi:DNA-binding XRE family transcriptional regulator
MPRRTPPTRDEQNALRRAFYEKVERGELSIPDAVKAMREMTGLTQAEFAAHRGVSRRVIQDIERGRGNPTVDSLNSIAKLFGLRIGFVSVRSKGPSSPAPG